MWSNIAEQARKSVTDALEKTGEALEKTGDAITKAATQPVAHQRQQQQQQQQQQQPSTPTATATTDTTTENDSNGAASSPSGDDARAAALAALGKVKLSEEKRKSKPTSTNTMPGISTSVSTDSTGTGGGGPAVMAPSTTPTLQVFSQFKSGWTNVVQTVQTNVVEKAQKGIENATTAMEKEQARLELLWKQNNAARGSEKFVTRPLHLPYDVPALKDAQVVYVTDRIISMSHPAMASSVSPEISGARKLAAVCHLLQKRHGSGNVMIWNLSEVTAYHNFTDGNQNGGAAVVDPVGPVIAFSFPGSPAPPLGLWLQLLLSLEGWLQASPQNVAVVHCLTGKGRTSTVLAAFLCWMAEAGFERSNMTLALEYIAQCKQVSPDDLTIPSQRRYSKYFTNMLEGVKPSQPPLVLKRILMSEAPHFAKGPPRNANNSNNTDKKNTNTSEQEQDETDRMGCAPYLQVFQAGQLLHTVAATLHFQQDAQALPFCQVADGSIAFHVDQVIQGDVLIRCRHLSHSTKAKVSMFRAAFHTGYVPPNVLRFKKAELDGACHDARFPDDFFVDLILEPCTAEQVSQFRREKEEAIQQHQQQKKKEALGGDDKEAEDQKPQNTKAAKPGLVAAADYDSMLHRDSRFWDVIAEHNKTKDKQKEASKDEDMERPARIGPTVGKRRVFTKSPKNSKGGSANASPAKMSNESAQPEQQPLQTFSIGGELDFLPEPQKVAPAAPKKDSLMDALMGALADEHDHDHDTANEPAEEIVFGEPEIVTSPTGSAAAAAQPSPTIVAIPPAVTEESGAATSSTPTNSTADASKSPPQKQESIASNSEQNSTTPSMNDMADLLATNDSEDPDIDALLGDDAEDFNLDDYNMDDDDDAELADLENFLAQK